VPALIALAAEVPPSPEPQPQADLPKMLEVTWSAGRHMPQGMQDNRVAWVDGWLVSVAGFCGGADDDWKPGKYPRGFLNAAWGLNLAEAATDWVTLPSMPGAPRQAMGGTCVGDSLYVWGGFSYSEPYTYRDGYRLTHSDGEWTWDELPPLPSPRAWGGTCAAGSKIYMLGGADYDAQRFYTLNDRTGNTDRLGAQLIVFDTQHPEAGWTQLTPCPGTPRCLAASAIVGGKLYAIGGVAVARDTGGYCNVVDNWRYDFDSDTWERVRDLPISGSGSSSDTVVYKDRYILIPCGYQYGEYMKIDGSLAPLYGTPSTVERTWESHPKFKDTHYYNHFYVYDTRTDLHGTATPLPFDDVASITVVLGDTVYMFPGETAGFEWEGEYFGHHPEFVLKGALEELPWE